jgi:hypothetical protein
VSPQLTGIMDVMALENRLLFGLIDVYHSHFAQIPADIGSVLRIWDVYLGSQIRVLSIPNPGSASKNLTILTQKIVSKLSEI